MKRAAATWSGEWWKAGGGGTAWESMVYDPELDPAGEYAPQIVDCLASALTFLTAGKADT